MLVTTPFTLVRLLSCHCFLFLRLSHLVLDGADQLFTLAPEQVRRHLSGGAPDVPAGCSVLLALALR